MLLHSTTGCSNSGNMGKDNEAETDYRPNVVIYEANPKVFAKKNTLNAISARIDAIHSLGTDILWIMPIYEQGVKNAVGSPYCVRDYKAINPEYGTVSDLKALVKKAHGEGMKVILDWVANHTSWDNAWITEHKDWYTQKNGEIISPEGFNWADVADLNYDSQQMRQAMIEAMAYWVKEADIDGFRCDYAEGVPNDFWAEAIKSVAKAKGGRDKVFMLAEGNNVKLYEAGFDAVYSWNTPYRVKDLFDGKLTVSGLTEFFKEDNSGVPESAYRMRYTTNHDMTANDESPITAFGGKDGAMAAFVLTGMMSDCMMIYSSQEIAYPKTLSFFTYNVLDWDSDKEYTQELCTFMQIHAKTAKFRKNTPELIQTTGGGVAVWLDGGQGNGMLAVINTSGSTVQIKVPMEQAGKSSYDEAAGSTTTIPQVLDMKPYEYKIYTIEQ